MGKKFFLITQVFYPDEVSTAGLFTNLCEEIAKRKINVEVWCAHPSYNTRQKQPRQSEYNGIKISYLPSSNFNKNNLIGRLINYITFSLSLLIKLLFTKDRSSIFTSTNPPYLGFLVTFIATLKQRKVNYIVQDVFPDGLIRLGKINPKGFIVWLWSSLNKYTLKKAEKIIVIGRDMLSELSNTYTGIAEKLVYIPIWQNARLVEPLDFNQNPFVINNKLRDKFIVQYSGNMGLWNDMATFGHVANELIDNDILFTFIGDGIRRKELTHTLSDKPHRNVAFYPFQPKDQIKNSLTACHIALISLNKGLEGIAVPSKIMGIFAAGIPSVALVPDKSEIAMLIRENNCGIVVEPGAVNDCVNAIRKLKYDEPLRNKMGKNAHKAFEEKYNTGIIAHAYTNLI